jgi:Predicted integral membrane protein (DUF2269)
MRKTLKFFHTLASSGLIGALLGYMIVLTFAHQETASSYAEARHTIALLCNYLLLPSLFLALITGLLSMAVHEPFRDFWWVWIKALLGLGMFEATLAVIQSKANYAATISAKMATGEASADALKTALNAEWTTLGAISVLSLANIVLGVWRPRLNRLGR